MRALSFSAGKISVLHVVRLYTFSFLLAAKYLVCFNTTLTDNLPMPPPPTHTQSYYAYGPNLSGQGIESHLAMDICGCLSSWPFILFIIIIPLILHSATS